MNTASDPGFDRPARFPEDSTATIVEKLSEEHGFVNQGPVPFAIGDRVRIIFNHACAVANLTDSYHLLTEAGTIRTWPVHARGLVH